jgi:uncharacterized peroxidase-related enzyme
MAFFIETGPDGDDDPNYARVFSYRPAVYAAWQGLNGSIKATMDPRRYELATLAAARALRSSYCTLAHGSVMLDQGLASADELEALAADHRAAGLSETEVAVMDLAEQVAVDATSVTQDDVDRLRSLGLTDPEIVDVVAAATARCFFSKTLDALGARADERYAALEPASLREKLTVGHPIAGG